jgi:phosphoserine phosphatase
MKKKKMTRRHVLPALIVVVIIGNIAVPALAADPLGSWREGANKQLIIEFVEKVTTPGSPSFVAPENRVATFDMDGTVLLEKPAYEIFAFAIPLIKATAAAQPALLERPHVKAIVDGDMKYFAKAGKFGPEGLYATLLETHTGKTEARYAADAHGFLFEQKHPRFQVPYAETVYLPMLEMIRYLEANGFRVYICSGSDVSFIRAMIEKSIGLPVENAIGTQVMTTWIEHDKGFSAAPETGQV